MMVDYQNPGWAWLINHGHMAVIGGVTVSRFGGPHPLLCGADLGHVLVAGDIDIRIGTAVETDEYAGYRIDQLMTLGPESRNIDRLVANGGRVLVRS